jgi:hypothetical protein
LTHSEVVESVLVPLVNQFGLMQQQMFDQFQQAMGMMLQMFGSMHRDQMEVIRAELEQIRELTEEFHTLKSELAKRTQNETLAKPHESEVGEGGIVQPNSMDSNTFMPPHSMLSETKANLNANRTSNGPSPSPTVFSSKVAGQRPSPESHRVVTQSSASSPILPSTPEPTVRTGSEPTPKADSRSPEPESDRATVLWLHQRIMTLQRERESRWQKVLKLVPGLFST